MDTLAEEVHEGFARMDIEFAGTNGRLESLEARTDARFEEVGRRFDVVGQRFDEADRRSVSIEETMKAGFDRIDAKFDAMHRLFFHVLCGLVGTLILALVTVISTH
jgi:hypothetical protein